MAHFGHGSGVYHDCTHACQHHHHHHGHHQLVAAPIIRNGVYQYPPGYNNAPPWPPIQPVTSPAYGQQTAYYAPQVHAPGPSQQDPKYYDAYHQGTLPREQRGYQPRMGDNITTYYPKTPAQLAFDNEQRARREGTYAPSNVEPEDKSPDRQWETIDPDGTRGYMTFATIKHGFPGGQWRAAGNGQWRYHMSQNQMLPVGFNLDSSDDEGEKNESAEKKKVDKKADKTKDASTEAEIKQSWDAWYHGHRSRN